MAALTASRGARRAERTKASERIMAWLQISWFSRTLMRTVPLNVLLPDKASHERPARTLYLLNGFKGDASEFLLNTDTTGMTHIYDCAIVMPSGENSAYINQKGSGWNYGDFVGAELVDYTRRILPLSMKREDCAIGGLSMGGYGALVAGLRFPGTFGHIIAMSGGFMGPESMTDEASVRRFLNFYGDPSGWDTCEGNPEYLAKRCMESGAALPGLYLSCGYNDEYCLKNRAYHHFLDSLGFPHVYEEGKGSHEWAFWRWSLPRGLSFCGWKHESHYRNPAWVEERDERYLPADGSGE